MSQTAFITGLSGAIYRDARYRKAAFDKLQQRKLKRLLEWARLHVDFQHERLARLNPASPNLRCVEPTDKSEMMRRFDDTIANRVISWADIEDIQQSTAAYPVVKKK